ncbi:MAG: ABC transporter permease, partial [Coriobacteriales bacterium]|nr:ABC transporter permease [Coriobacteriales bacterium]
FADANGERMADFDMGKMLSIDEEAIANAFNFDSDALSGFDMSNINFAQSLDFSQSLDLGSMSIGMSEMPALDLSGILSDLEVSDLPLQGLADFALAVLGDYLADRMPDDLGGEAAELLTSFSDYLQSPDGQAALTVAMLTVIDLQGLSDITTEVINAYMDYCQDQGISDSVDLIAGFPAWLMQYWEDEQLADRFTGLIHTDLIIGQVVDLVGSFLVYSDITFGGVLEDVGTDFSDWLSIPEVSALVSTYFDEFINLTPLINKISSGFTDYISQFMQAFMYQFMTALQWQLTTGMGQAMGQVMSQLSASMADAFKFDDTAFANAFQFNINQDDLGQLMLSMLSRQQKTYENNLKLLGYANPAEPSSIAFYPLDFVSKQQVLNVLDDYNKHMDETGQGDKVVVYTDYVGALMSSVTDIIDMISMVLVAFVAISLIVSSIMIGIVTYISVLERKKEIGILRSIGASKQDIGNVFNAETLIIGFSAGVIGILVTALCCIPANIIVEASLDVRNIAQLPLMPSVILIGISCLLSFVAGLIPSAAASRRDPVEALRSE